MKTDVHPIHLTVSAYDRAAGWVVSLNLLVGSAVLLGFLVWLSQTMERGAERSTVVLVERIAGRGDHAAGFERDVDPPGIEELEEETEPQVEQMLEAVTEVVATQRAALDAMQTTVSSSRVGTGMGDSRPPGPLGEGDDIIPRGERWEIHYLSNALPAYAEQLDYFGIELGLIGGGERLVDYASNLRQLRPTTRQGPSDQEKRLYMIWTEGALKRFDQQLLRAAGLRTAGRIVVQFYPQAVEERLAQIEMEYARRNGRTSVKQIKQTVFGVRRQGAELEYYVISQVYRTVPV